MKQPLKYPIGIQTFEEIRKGGYAYVDKTGYVHQLIDGGAKHVFLSRPRRFGKSLLLSTFQAYFEGKKELFEGLEIAKLETEWQSYPVLHFSFGSMAAEDTIKVENYVNEILKSYEKRYDVDINDHIPSFGTRFGLLIQNVASKTGKKVVVLIDEYDKGIVEMLHNKEQLDRNIDTFRPFYAQLKDQDQYLKFAFLTGVSRFRNLTLFSSPNQLQDISMDAKFAAICGMTANELYSVLAEGVEELAEKQNISVDEAKYRLKLKYDSYRFTRKKELVYNPFSILNCLQQCSLENFWITSGTSKVFINYLRHSKYTLEEIENKQVSSMTLGQAYSIENPIPLLFQTGYLTIVGYDREYDMYRLGIPNGEVRSALVEQLVPQYMGIDSDDALVLSKKLGILANRGDAEGLIRELRGILSGAAHQHFRLNDTENVYNYGLWLVCKMAGLDARSEVSVAGGDIDMLITTPEYVYVIEFKKDHSAEEALQQIETKRYALPWSADGRKVYKIGVEFSSENRNIARWIIRQ